MQHLPTLKQLEALYWTARLGSFQLAADRLCTSQSAIAKRVNELESRFGVRLLSRHAKGHSLTVTGQRFFERAQDVLAATRRLLDAMQPDSAFTGVIRVATLDMFAATWLPEWIDAVRDRSPQASLALEVGGTQDNLDRLRHGQVDLVFSPVPLVDGMHISIELGRTRFVWMASTRMRLPSTQLTPQQLGELPLIIHSTQQHRFAPELGVPSEPQGHAITVDGYSLMLQLALAGHGVCYLPEAYLHDELARGQLVCLEVPEMPADKPFYAVYRKDMAPPLMNELVAQAQACFAEFAKARLKVELNDLRRLPLTAERLQDHWHAHERDAGVAAGKAPQSRAAAGGQGSVELSEQSGLAKNSPASSPAWAVRP